ELADAGGDDPDRAGAGDQHVLADHVELQRAVRGVAVGIEERGKLRRHLIRDRPQVAGRHHDVLGEGAVAVDPDPDRVRAQVRAPAAAVAAVAADDMALGGDALADAVAVHARADLGDAAHELVPDHQPGPDGALAPFVPQVDVQVGAADRGLLDLDQHLVGTGLGHRHVLHPDALSGLALDQRPHRPGHRPPALGKAPDYTRRARYPGATGPGQGGRPRLYSREFSPRWRHRCVTWSRSWRSRSRAPSAPSPRATPTPAKACGSRSNSRRSPVR